MLIFKKPFSVKFAFFLAALFLNNVQSGCFFKIYLENNSILVHLKNRLRDQLITDIDPSNLANFYELNTGREANNKPPYFGATTPKQNIVGYHMTITSPGTNQQKIRQAKLALRNFLRNDGSIEIQSIAHFNRYIVARVSPRYPPNMPAQRQTRLQGHWQTAFGNAPHISLIQLTDFQNPTSIGDNETSAASINRLRTVFRHPFNDSPDLRLYLGIQNYNDFLNLNQRIKLYDLVAAHVKQLIYDTPMPNGQATLRGLYAFHGNNFQAIRNDLQASGLNLNQHMMGALRAAIVNGNDRSVETIRDHLFNQDPANTGILERIINWIWGTRNTNAQRNIRREIIKASRYPTLSLVTANRARMNAVVQDANDYLQSLPPNKRKIGFPISVTDKQQFVCH